MIDFRYHLVSIVSIFLALAVGIVLGAGPLKGELGNTLNKEVAGLRKDKIDLNKQLQEARAGTEARDAYIAEITRYLEGERVLAHPEGLLERAGRVFGRYRAAILLILAYLVVRSLLLVFGGRP